ncbi:hypothetical protein EDD53_1149 [Pacificibacter maritimus]|uniref:Flp pilus assembly protein TadG n=1 Tax=Pacificibacter maritimus TaxID=762213 RepID=A0A3N4UN25_9RHOB|nr:hypothetical protein [Pacificibacter maritimus]RPE72012.1 hypothetical protein EDD53_1149 [Pacificibacter maritimus]
MKIFRNLLRARQIGARYGRSEHGSMSVEAILVLPVIFFGLMFIYTYFAAFQLKGLSNKATYTVSDYLSRQTEPVDSNFIEGLSDIYQFLTNADSNYLRVSSVTWSIDDGEGAYELQWSYGANSVPPLTDIADIQERLPLLALGETILVLEASNDFNPLFNIGLNAFSVADFVATKPRFATQVVFDDGSSGGGTPASGDDVQPTDTYGTYGGRHHRGTR